MWVVKKCGNGEPIVDCTFSSFSGILMYHCM